MFIVELKEVPMRTALLSVSVVFAFLSQAVFAEVRTEHPNGYFAYQQTRTPIDRDKELKDKGNGRLARVPGSGEDKNFSAVCREVGKSCVFVIDWTGKKLKCREKADDGSRAAFCAKSFGPGCYAYESTGSPKDREQELQGVEECGGRITRLTTFGYGDWGDFGRVCKEVGRSCKNAIDWEGTTRPCSSSSLDGSRVAHCE